MGGPVAVMAVAPEPPAIRLHDVTIAYGRHVAIERVSGRFETGSLTAVTGPNGAGKSTLIKVLVGVIEPTSGFVARGGDQAGHLAYLPQATTIDRGFPLSVGDTVLLGAWRWTGALRGIPPALAAKARAALHAVGLGGLERRAVGDLSVGQFRRVLFARLLLQDARTIVLDEPFAAIDITTTRVLLRIISQWHAQGRTVIVVTHDLALARAHFPQALLLARRVIAWGDTAGALRPDHLQQALLQLEDWAADTAVAAAAGERRHA